MESLQIRTGEVKLQILDDSGEERGIFKFNPEDVAVAQRFVDLQREFVVKQQEFNDKEKTCDTEESKIALLNEIVDYFKSAIDSCWGDGTSKLLFGDYKSVSMFADFFNGITPYYAEASKKRKQKYTNK